MYTYINTRSILTTYTVSTIIPTLYLPYVKQTDSATTIYNTNVLMINMPNKMQNSKKPLKKPMQTKMQILMQN